MAPLARLTINDLSSGLIAATPGVTVENVQRKSSPVIFKTESVRFCFERYYFSERAFHREARFRLCGPGFSLFLFRTE